MQNVFYKLSLPGRQLFDVAHILSANFLRNNAFVSFIPTIPRHFIYLVELNIAASLEFRFNLMNFVLCSNHFVM